MNLKQWFAIAVLFFSAVLFGLIFGLDHSPQNLQSGKIQPAPKSLQDSKKTRGQKREKTSGDLEMEILRICKNLTDALKKISIAPTFSRVDVRFHEARLKTSSITAPLEKCFGKANDSSHRIEIDVFSADFDGEDARDHISIQISVVHRKSKNKIHEDAAHFETSFLENQEEARTSDSTRQ